MKPRENLEQETVTLYFDALLLSYRLLSYCQGSKRFAELTLSGGPAITMHVFHLQKERAEWKGLITHIATLVRTGSDIRRELCPTTENPTEGIVGTITQEEKTAPLKLREACNKIIHALRFTFEEGTVEAKHVLSDVPEHLQSDEPVKLSFLRPAIQVDGFRLNKGKQVHWNCTIDLEKFAHQAGAAFIAFTVILDRSYKYNAFVDMQKPSQPPKKV